MMGSAAAGAVSMGLVPRTGCGPGNIAVRRPGRQTLLPRRPTAASAARRIDSTAMAMATAVMAWRRLTPSMRRIDCPERDDWRATAESAGFDFHTIDGERYWDERAYYAFTLDEIEREIEAPTAEIDAMCLELVGHAIDDEEYPAPAEDTGSVLAPDLRKLAPRRGSLYGRLDLSFDGHGPAKLLEYNADTPTSIFESAVFQWKWLEEAIERNIIPKRSDQFNSIHERLIDAWKNLAAGHVISSRWHDRKHRRSGTLSYLEDTASQAGPEDDADRHRGIGLRRGRPVRRSRQPRNRARVQALSLGMDVPRRVRRRTCESLDALDRAALEGDPLQQGHSAAAVGDVPESSQSAAGLFRGRPGCGKARHLVRAQAALFARRRQCRARQAGTTLVEQEGPYGAEGFIRQALAPLPNFSGKYAVLGSWLVDHTPCGLSIREDENPITGNTSRFLPHAIFNGKKRSRGARAPPPQKLALNPFGPSSS